jgi:hypothetical protein
VSNSATRTSGFFYIRVVVILIVVAMSLGASLGLAQTQNSKQQTQQAAKPQAQSQTAASSPCGAAGTPAAGASQSAANASAAVKNTANAVSNLGSLFGKKKPANQGANQPANPSADAAAACDPTVNAAAGAAAGVGSTVDSVESLGGPAAAGSGATPGTAAVQPGAAAPASAPATPAAARAPTTPAARGSASAAATPAPAVKQPAAAAQPVPAAAPSPLAPAAPPNFAKLPDVNGIQLGMTVDQALAKVKALYPNPANMTVSYVKFEKTAEKPWVQDIVLGAANPQNNAEEHLDVRFNDPPDEQRVIFVSRSLTFQQGKQTTLANMRAALLQKYGQPRSSISETLIWSFDEQGNPVTDPKLNATNCSGAAQYNHAGGGGGPNNPGIAFVGVDPAQADLQQNPCYFGVHVSANTGTPMPDGLVISLEVAMGENSYATRTYMDEQAYIKNAANQAQQEQFKKAQERSAPKL